MIRATCAMACLGLTSCSVLFKHTEQAILPAGTSLEELGIAILADVEGWVDAILWLGGLFGWL